MAINLAEKYENKIAEKFVKSSFVAGHASSDYSFEGVKTISIYTPQTVGLSDYNRTGKDRFGAPVEMQDELQTLTLGQDKGFSITIDRGNNSDQMMVKNAGKMMNIQISEQVVPYMDRYALGVWARQAGTVAPVTAPTKNTVITMIFEGAKELDNALAPDDNRTLFLPTSIYNMVRLSPEFQGVDRLADRALSRGVVGSIADMTCVKVPDSYMPDKVYFLMAHKKSVLAPNKIKTARILTEVQGIDGAVLEGRNYFDAFVVGARAGGVYAAAASNAVTAAPEIAIASGKATLTCATAGAAIRFTVDGSDPRYSRTAETYVAPAALAAGQKLRAFAAKGDMLPSGVAEKTNG